MSRILVTGGAGFIGASLSMFLSEEHEVDIVDSFARGVRDEYLESLEGKVRGIYELDLLNGDSWNKLPSDYDFIVHLAAIIGVRHVMERPYQVLRDNVLLTARAIEFASRQQDLSKFLFASTSEVMAGSLVHMDLTIPTPESFPLALTDLSSPRTSYMLSKIYGEAMCLQSGLKSVLIRPHNIYGPRMGLSHVVPELLQKAHRMNDGDTLEVASVHHSRAMCYIEDAIEMIAALLLSDAAGVFNIGNEKTEITIGELAAMVVEAVGKDLRVQPVEVAVGSPSRRCPDMNKTIQATGLQPSISVREGIARTYEWYRSNVFDGEGKSAI